MKIDQFPTEVLMKIFSYLPRYDEVLLVNKRFYAVACKVNDPNICLRIDRYFNWDWVPSIINSTKQVSKVDIEISKLFELTETKLRTIISIIKKFSASIKYLKLSYWKDLTLPQFLEVLSLVPNVEHLIFYRLNLQAETDQPTKEKTSSKDDLKLQQLKKLKFSKVHDDFLAVFNRVPVGVLQDLKLSYINVNALVVLFKRQINIKKLKLKRVRFTTTIAADIFDNLKLESFEFRGSFNIAIFLSNQTKLKSLKMCDEDVDEYFLKFVATQFTELETFHIDVFKAVSATSIAKISKLKTLKDLSLRCSSNKLESLAKLENPRITALSVNCGGLEHSHIHALSNSMPNLKVLRACSEGNPQIVNFVEVLEICGWGFNQLTEGDCFNRNLMELTIGGSLEEPFLNKLIADYPNLKKLSSRHRVSSTQFKRILDGFKKLESLELDYASELTMDDLKYLMDSKHNLKFISLGYLGVLRVEFTDELKRQFSAAFGVVIYSRYGRVQMAVDRNIMNSERRFKLW